MIIHDLEPLEVVIENSSILGEVSWVPASNGYVPPNTVPGGYKQWNIREPLIPPDKAGDRPRTVDHT